MSPIPHPRACRACGSTELTWHTTNTTHTNIQDGRLKLNEVTCLFFLGCDYCSETLATINADRVAAAMTEQARTCRE